LTFPEAVSVCVSKSFNAKGRASRSEFWWFYLFSLVLYFVTQEAALRTGNLLFSLIWLLVIPAEISAGIRRMHDIDKSGWFQLIPFYNVVLLATEGTQGPNRFDEESARSYQ